MKAKENGFWLGVIIIVLLLTFKIWIKLTFEIQMLGLVLLVASSWTLKYYIFKIIKNKNKK